MTHSFLRRCALALLVHLPLVSLAQSTSYSIDPTHTVIAFKVMRFGMLEVPGRFKTFSGSIEYDGSNVEKLTAKITIATASMSTDHEQRDADLRGPVWLDAAKYPDISFVSKSVMKKGDGYVMTGEFSLHGVTKTIEIPFKIKGPFVDPTRTTTLALVGSLSINRIDYGIAMNKKMPSGDFFIGDEVKIELMVLAALPRAAAPGK